MRRKIEDANRRTVLKQIGAVGTASATGLVSNATAENKTTTDGSDSVVRAQGTKLIKTEFDPETVTVQEWYISPDLEERYGDAQILFDDVEYRRERLEEALKKELPENGQNTIRHELDTLVGTEQEWKTHHRNQKEKQSQQVGAASKSDYSGPIYEYKESSSGQYTITAPINAVFEVPNRSISEIKSKMTNWSRWTNSDDCGSNRYVFMAQGTGGYFAAQHEQIGTDTACLDPRDHLRMWYDAADNWGNNDDQFVVGSLHHDPSGHTCIKEFGYPYYTFEEPEQRFKDDWSSNTSATVGSIDLNNAKDWNQCKQANDDYAAYINW